MYFLYVIYCFFQSILEFYSEFVEEHFHQFLDDFMNFSQNPLTFTIDWEKSAYFVKTAKNAIFATEMVTYLHLKISIFFKT